MSFRFCNLTLSADNFVGIAGHACMQNHNCEICCYQCYRVELSIVIVECSPASLVYSNHVDGDYSEYVDDVCADGSDDQDDCFFS